MAQCRGKGLIVVDSRLQSAALHAKANLDRAVAFDFVNPRKLVNASALRDITASDEFPRSVAFVIAQLLCFSVKPFLSRGGGLSVIFRGARRVGAQGSLVDGEHDLVIASGEIA